MTRRRKRLTKSLEEGGREEWNTPAPASQSIMPYVTHATLLHYEPCYASARQDSRGIYGGILTVIERHGAVYTVFAPSKPTSVTTNTIFARLIRTILSKMKNAFFRSFHIIPKVDRSTFYPIKKWPKKKSLHTPIKHAK